VNVFGKGSGRKRYYENESPPVIQERARGEDPE